MSYQHKSGAQKRKEREKREASAKKGQKTFDSFFVKSEHSARTNEVSVTDSQSEPLDIVELSADETSETSTSIAAGVDILPENVKLDLDEEGDEQKNYAERNPDADDDNENKTVYDIGQLENVILGTKEMHEAVLSGPTKPPSQIAVDFEGNVFPQSALVSKMKNNEKVNRDWLTWSKSKNAFYCLPCRIFSKLPTPKRSTLACPEGFSGSKHSWKRIHDKLTPHENSSNHKACYVEWRNLEKSLLKNKPAIDTGLTDMIKNEVARWKAILQRILHVILFLGERGLPLRGDSNLVGDPRNGNFLGILELIAHYDPILNDHLSKVKQSQTQKKRLQVHYLSVDIQNEFIVCCAQKIRQKIVEEISEGKYFSIIVDSTPDSSHVEQTVFILRYVTPYVEDDEISYKVNERFLKFVDCSKKTGEAIADMIKSTLKEHDIPLENCRGQGYDNASNMSGVYKGVQSRILDENPLALYSPCAAHSLNLCGEQAAQSSVEAVTFFGIVQKCYNVFSSSPQRWEILQECIGCSLHSPSQTRWSARVDSVRPFAAHLPGLKKALKKIQELHLTPQTLTEIRGIERYLDSFECLLMSSIWLKVLVEINAWNLILQARQTTLDVEVANLQHLIDNLTTLRSKWSEILQECTIVADNIGIAQELPEKRKKIKRLADKSTSEEVVTSPEDNFKTTVFFVLIDSVIGNMTNRYQAATSINDLFMFLWKYPMLSEEDLKQRVMKWSEKYKNDVEGEQLLTEVQHLKIIQPANFKGDLKPVELLNTLAKQNLSNIFPNVVIALRIFCTMPVTVAEGERSFSLLSRVKNFLRSTMTQDRLTSLAMLALENDLAKTLSFDDVIETFANKKSRKVAL